MERPTETIIKRGKSSFEGKTTAKTFKGWLLGRISKHSKQNNIELRFIFEGILNAYNHFHPETSLEVTVESWKGKSSFEILQGIDKITIIKYQKPAKGEEPKQVRTEVSHKELKNLVRVITNLSNTTNSKKLSPVNSPNEIPTRQLAKAYCYAMEYFGYLKDDFWKNFFSDRKIHNKFTLMLGALDKIGLIKYHGGKTTLLNSKMSLQEALENYE